ncbi:rRNA-binding ribosome biosynthesis protein utp25 [Malassezia sp. CBS 17886]|nr:rRNA-binding ribosome biosynthesis protein utp25 [Malassezia sp. CBS 17886]
MGDSQAHVRLLTLLNARAMHPRDNDASSGVARKRLRMGVSAPPAPAARDDGGKTPPVLLAADDSDDEKENEDVAHVDAFHAQYAPDSEALAAVDPAQLTWAPPTPVDLFGGAFRTLAVPRPGAVVRAKDPRRRSLVPIFATPRVPAFFSPLPALTSASALQYSLQQQLGAYEDLWYSRVAIDEHASLRTVTAMHAMSHVAKYVGARVLKDNERLAKAAALAREEPERDEELPEFRDQGFTRPKVLVLAPFRNAAKAWVNEFIAVSGCEQVEQKTRFTGEFSLPPGTLDRLADRATADRYPVDHRHVFQGNIDDNFKLGIKLTRKSLKLYSAFFESDLLVASPLALRLLIEKEKGADFLSSIEVVVVDQMDVMLMQNWDHVKFVLAHVNRIPQQAHDTDFSRVKPWYLDEHAALLRQTVLFSAFDAPEFRQLYHQLCNVSGRVRTTAMRPHAEPSMALVEPGIRQTFTKFACANAQGDPDARLAVFLDKTLPHLQRSAVSASHTMIVVPSYFDFVRLENHFRRADPPVSYTTLSEYSSNKEITRAREAFFSGKKSLLLLTERFHFYRRYLIRGAQTIVFYALPEHALYYPELANAPLVRRADAKSAGEPVDAADINVVVLFSRYDLLRLERVVGVQQARRMVSDAKSTWRFA